MTTEERAGQYIAPRIILFMSTFIRIRTQFGVDTTKYPGKTKQTIRPFHSKRKTQVPWLQLQSTDDISIHLRWHIRTRPKE
jgi:hypothetical protein